MMATSTGLSRAIFPPTSPSGMEEPMRVLLEENERLMSTIRTNMQNRQLAPNLELLAQVRIGLDWIIVHST